MLREKATAFKAKKIIITLLEDTEIECEIK